MEGTKQWLPPSFRNFGDTGLGAAMKGPLSQGQAHIEGRLNDWILQGGLNKLMSENCIFRGAMSGVVGYGGGIALGAFLAPFDSMGGMKVS